MRYFPIVQLIWILCSLIAPAVAKAGSKEVLVPRLTIYPGEVIRADTVVERAFDARTVARVPVFEQRDSVAGRVARRTLLPGHPIPLTAVRDAYLVTQGQSALVVYTAGDLTITCQALALQSGAGGDTITLRNAESGIVIKGLVQADGSVQAGQR